MKPEYDLYLEEIKDAIDGEGNPTKEFIRLGKFNDKATAALSKQVGKKYRLHKCTHDHAIPGKPGQYFPCKVEEI